MEDFDVKTQTFERFAENPDVVKIINSIVKHSGDPILLEADLEKMTVMFDKYQEQPHLLDPYLEDFVNMLLAIIKDEKTPNEGFHQAFRYLYIITKVRGFKLVIRLFTHDVSALEQVLEFLSRQSPTDYKTWETRYVLLLWLAIVCIIPFDLSRLDGKTENESELVVNRIIKVAMVYLCASDKSKDASAFLISKFLTRPDLKGDKVKEFMEWCLDSMKFSDGNTMAGVNTMTGVLNALALLFKHGKRDEFLPYATFVLSTIDELNLLEVKNALVRKLAVKLVQRVGLTFLKPRITSWRYTRGTRSLAQNLTTTSTKQAATDNNTTADEDIEGEEDFDIPEEVETVIGFLISALEDTDTIVRWSAAKGIGRLTGRLPLELADEVLTSLQSCFMYTEQDGAWHGGCLALAELGRRGLLLPKHLPEVVPIVLKALLYDERRVSYSVGSHVRDAACYVCWSFARAYHPQQIKPFVQDIANALLIVTVFDREVNCRRAASAAFQENVGRQGMFPHGIDILTAADYFAVGNRVNCFTNLSVYIAGFPEYTHQLIDHLATTKIAHWDSVIRELTSQALFQLTKTDPEYMQHTVLPRLLEQTSSFDICAKHGSILALGEVIHALYLHHNKAGVTFVLEDSSLQAIKTIIPRLHKGNELRGFGGELLRKASCKLIEKLSLSHCHLNDGCGGDGCEVLDVWLNVVETTLPHTEPLVQAYAIDALTPFCNQYIKSSDHFNQDEILKRFLAQLRSNLKFDRMGYAQAIGALPCFMFGSSISVVMSSMMECCKVDANDKVNAGLYAESRRDSARSILSLCEKIGVRKLEDQLSEIFECLFCCMKDYTIDSRGDVGAWVREEAMATIVELCLVCVRSDVNIVNETLCERIMRCLFQQLAEKIDRIRLRAGQLILKFLYNKPTIHHIPDREEIENIIPQCSLETVNWAAPNEVFAFIQKLLHIERYQYPLLLGIAVSAGGLTESLVRHSSECILQYLSDVQENEMEMDKICSHFVRMLHEYKKDDRVIVPLFKFLETLFSSGCFDIYSEDEQKSDKFPLELLRLLKEEMKTSGEIRKILASINVFCCLVQFVGEVRHKCLHRLLIFLCHKYPRVRKATAEQLYTTFLIYDDVLPDDRRDDIMNKLTDVSWDGSLDIVRQHRNDLCEWLNVPVPVLNNKRKATTSQQQPSSQVDELDSYKDLVSRLQGY